MKKTRASVGGTPSPAVEQTSRQVVVSSQSTISWSAMFTQRGESAGPSPATFTLASASHKRCAISPAKPYSLP